MKKIILLTSIICLTGQLYAQSGNEIVIDDLTSTGNCDLSFANMIEPVGSVKQTECIHSGAIGGSADVSITKQQEGAASIGYYYAVVSGTTYKSFELNTGNGGIFPFSLTYDGIDGNTDPNNPTLTGPVLGDFTNKTLRIVASIEAATSVTLTGKIWDGSGNVSTTQIVLTLQPSTLSQNYDFPAWTGTANLADVRAFQLSYTTAQGSHDLSIDKISVINLNPLPVSLMNFTASNIGSDVELKWSTASEINTKCFDVESSYDAKTFTPIGKVAAKGNPTEMSTYFFSYEEKSQGDVYYRLKMMDNDGTFTHSKIVKINSILRTEDIEIFPTVFGQKVNCTLNSHSDQKAVIELFNVNGLLCKRITTNLNKGSNFIAIEGLQELACGTYYLQIKGEENMIITRKKIIKN